MIGLEYIANLRLMTYKSIADEIGVSTATINDWLRKNRNIPNPRLKQLSILLDVDEEIIKKKVDISDKIYLVDIEKYRLLKELEGVDNVKTTEMYGIYGIDAEPKKTELEYEIGEIITLNSNIDMMCKKKEIVNGKLYQFFRQGKMVFD